MLMKRTTCRHTACSLLLAALSLYAGSQSLSAQTSGVSAEDRLAEIFSYYLKDGGIWRQDNVDREAGSDSPVAYVKRYQWGPGRSIVLDDTFALMEDGQCKAWTHNVFHWDTSENVVRGQIFHLSGARFSGLIRMTALHQTSAEFAGVLPDGTEFKMRDKTDLSDPHEAVVTAFIPDGEGWSESAQVSWVQVTTSGKPCGF